MREALGQEGWGPELGGEGLILGGDGLCPEKGEGLLTMTFLGAQISLQAGARGKAL